MITRSARFKAHINATLAEVVKDEVALLNLYSYKPSETPEVEDEIEEAIEAEPSPYDSHPSPKDRIAAALALAEPARAAGPDDQKFAWSLFSERKQLEEQMTDEVRDRIFEAHRVTIPRTRPEKTEEEDHEKETDSDEAASAE